MIDCFLFQSFSNFGLMRYMEKYNYVNLNRQRKCLYTVYSIYKGIDLAII